MGSFIIFDKSLKDLTIIPSAMIISYKFMSPDEYTKRFELIASTTLVKMLQYIWVKSHF